MFKDKRVILLIAAAGSGTRLGADIPKQFIKMEGLGGLSPLQKSIVTAGSVKEIDRVIVITNPEYMNSGKEQIEELEMDGPAVELIPGGETRQDSLGRGVRHALNDNDPYKPEDTLVLIHDAARPNASVDLYNRVIRKAFDKGAVVPGVPVKDTIRHLEEGTLDRSKLLSVQTPQGFLGNVLLEAVEHAEDSCFVATDEGSLVENLGYPVATVLGSNSNTKITNPEDMGKNLCVGTGYDVHAFAEGRKLILGGVEIPWEKGLMGHSDADVLTHAFMDGILGAMGEGDIGLHFPDSDSKYEGVSSLKLLEEVGALMKKNFYTLENADITVICQKPKIRPFVESMRANLMEIVPARYGINIKGTTTERLGFEGRGEGIAVQATVLLSKMTWGE